MNKNNELTITVDSFKFKVTWTIIDMQSASIDITCPPNLIKINADMLKQLVNTVKIQLSLGNIIIDNINLNNGLKEIGYDSFRETAIKKIITPITLEWIGYSAFEDCNRLEIVILNEGLKIISSGAFRNTPIREINIPRTVEEICDAAFENCIRLKKITLNEGLERIGREAFKKTAIVTLTLPRSVTHASRSSIEGCVKLKEVVLAPKINITDKSSNDQIEKLQEMLSKKDEVVAFNKENFEQHRQNISENVANELGIRLIELASEEHVGFTRDYIKRVLHLLVEGANPDMQDGFGNTGLMWMIYRNIEECIHMYLASGCDVNIANSVGDTALIMAVRRNMIDLVKSLLDMGANPQHQNKTGESALNIAIANNYFTIVNLIKKKETINSIMTESSRPFNLAEIKARAKKLKEIKYNKGVKNYE